jgi:hypothetical protein
MKIQRLQDIPEGLFNILIQHLPKNHKCGYGRGCWFNNKNGPKLIKDFKEHKKASRIPQADFRNTPVAEYLEDISSLRAISLPMAE